MTLTDFVAPDLGSAQRAVMAVRVRQGSGIGHGRRRLEIQRRDG